MWLITALVAAIAATAAWFVAPKKLRLDVLSMLLWGASAMIFVDHVLGYDGGEFIKMTTSGMITNGTVLGIAMLIPVFIIWEVYVAISMKREGK